MRHFLIIFNHCVSRSFELGDLELQWRRPAVRTISSRFSNGLSNWTIIT